MRNKKIPVIAAACLVFIFAFAMSTNSMSSYAQSESMAFTYFTNWGSFGEGDGQFDGQNDVDFYNGKVYIPDYANHRIQVFDPNGKFLAKFGEGGEGDGQFHKASALSIDKDGNLYIADHFNYRIQKFTADG